MTKHITQHKFYILLIIIGLISALMLNYERLSIESDYKSVMVVMTADDAAVLDSLPNNVTIYDGSGYIDGVTILTEDENQYSYNMDLSGELGDNYTATRAFYLYPDFAARYAYLGYESYEEVENILYRAVTDRNVRVIWLTAMVNSQTGETITETETYNEMLSSLAERLSAHNIVIGDEFSSITETVDTNTLAFLLIAIATIAAGFLLLATLIKLSDKIIILLFSLAVIGTLGILFIFNEYFVTLFALAVSIIFPCLAFYYLAINLRDLAECDTKSAIIYFIKTLIIAFSIAFVGCIFIAALQSHTDYLLAIKNFSGVKLSQFLPLLYALYIVLRDVCPISMLKTMRKSVLILIFFAIMIFGAYYILRTGNSNVLELELRFRNFLEEILLARPRTKEFLIAIPCLALSIALISKGLRQYSAPFALFSMLEFSGIVNTFCHSRAPLYLSTVRSVLGLVIGAVLGVLVMIIMRKKS